ncbi:MAG: hypothetical protein ABR529_01060 [Actinomycetota bacterium]
MTEPVPNESKDKHEMAATRSRFIANIPAQRRWIRSRAADFADEVADIHEAGSKRGTDLTCFEEMRLEQIHSELRALSRKAKQLNEQEEVRRGLDALGTKVGGGEATPNTGGQKNLGAPSLVLGRKDVEELRRPVSTVSGCSRR